MAVKLILGGAGEAATSPTGTASPANWEAEQALYKLREEVLNRDMPATVAAAGLAARTWGELLGFTALTEKTVSIAAQIKGGKE